VIPKVNMDRFSDNKIVDSIKSVAIPFESIEKYPIDSLLERAIGVIYRPQTERMSHYFHALLPSQFDEYIFFNTTKAIKPLSDSTFPSKTLLEHPFGFIDS
ncbi:MAG TPA: hypothetical protein ENK67_03580, partial [Flavobacteriia bacterium]|nr:hypothetical protein [Flavobacteriia bacterium]